MYAHRDAGGPAAAEAPAAGPGGIPGDGAAFEALYERYRPQLVAYCRRRLREDWREAEDAAHEALLRAYCALPSFDASTDADAWPWLATIAARICTDIRRHNARTAAVPESTVEAGGTGAVGGVGGVVRARDVHEQVADRLRADIVEDALGLLPAQYRTTLFLKEFAGWRCDEIARIQGTSVAAVRSLLVRGRRRLGTEVEELARSRGQWPLPTVVPSVMPSVAARARARLREWRESSARSGQVLLAALDPMGLVGGLLLGSQATAAAAVAVVAALVPGGHATGAVVPAPAPVEVRAPVLPSASGAGDPLARTGAQVVEDLGDGYVTNLWYAPRETLARVDSPQPPLPAGSAPAPPVHAEAAIESRDEAIWVRGYAALPVPAIGFSQATAEVNVACGPTPQRQACSRVRNVLRSLSEP